MPIPDFQTLMRPVLVAAAARPIRMPEVAIELANQFKLSVEEREELLPSGRQRLFYNRLAWAKFHLTKAGMVASPTRGSFEATAAGRKLLEKAPERIDIAVLRQQSASYAKIGRPAIQGFVGSLVGHGASKGVFVTMTSFSKEAMAYAGGLRERVVLNRWRPAVRPLD